MTIPQIIQESINTKQQMLQEPTLVAQLEFAIDLCVSCFKQDGKVYFAVTEEAQRMLNILLLSFQAVIITTVHRFMPRLCM